jgi:hypothetical protein
MCRVHPGNAIGIHAMTERFGGKTRTRSCLRRAGTTAPMTLGGGKLDPENRSISHIAGEIDGTSQRLHQSLGYTLGHLEESTICRRMMA